MLRRTLIAIAAFAISLTAPAAAQAAATIGFQGEDLVFEADPSGGDSHITLRTVYDQNNDPIGDFPAIAIPSSGATYDTENCIHDGDYIVCNWPRLTRFVGAGGVDDLYVSFDFPASEPVELFGHGGSDELRDLTAGSRLLDGGPGNDLLRADRGDDRLFGGDGNDELEGHDGNDEVRGGGGDDLLSGAEGADVIDGGPGFDKINSDWSYGAQISVTVDGQPGDGRSGENDNVIDVEHISSAAPGTFVMTQGVDKVEVFASAGEGGGTSTVRGLGGNDDLRTGDTVDDLDGGPGDDTLTGGFNNDTITGGPGRDNIFGDATGSFCGIFSCKIPYGNDTINASDGAIDNIDCGVGTDTATADPGDVVANCETVNRVAGGGGGGGAGLGGTFSVLRGQRLLAALARGLKIRVNCRRACRVRGDFLVNSGLLARSVSAAKGSKRLRRAGRATLVLKFTRKAKRKLRRFRRVSGTVRVTVRPLRGGRASTKRKRVTLRR